MTDYDFSVLVPHIAPNSRVHEIEQYHQGFSNLTYGVTVLSDDDVTTKYIVKFYRRGSLDFQHDSAKHEYQLLQFLTDNDIPAAKPVLSDTESMIFDAPILVMMPLVGRPIMAHPANPEWENKADILAVNLAKIHQLQCPESLIAALPPTMRQKTWFLEDDTIPDYMQTYPDGETIWHTIREYIDRIVPSYAALTHGDYWSGNILWENDQLTGILDWEMAGYGATGFDVGYCRLEMALEAMGEASDIFLRTYEERMGHQVEHLGFYELASAVHSMQQRAPFLTIDPFEGRYRQFVADALKRL